MDALDAGAYAYRFEADIPKNLKVVLWGPLQAKELGFDGWKYQDGGETGFVYHLSGRPVRLGLATASLIVVRRLGKAYLSVYLGGYPTDAAPEQRRIDVGSLANEAALFLTRLANQTIEFAEPAEWTLVEPTAPAVAATTRGDAKRFGRRSA